MYVLKLDFTKKSCFNDYKYSSKMNFVMYKITLEWTEEGRTRTRTISDKDNTKQIGKIFIGRDEKQCDIALPTSEKTVSRLHVVIYYDSRRKGWYLTNLTSDRQAPNPAIVDGKIIILEEILLSVGSKIQLGKIHIIVKQIEVHETQSAYGIKCVNGHVLPYDYMGDFCPYCGYALQANETIYLPIDEREINSDKQDT